MGKLKWIVAILVALYAVYYSRCVYTGDVRLDWKTVIVAVLVALYGVYYWRFIYSRRVYTGDVQLKGKTVIVTGGNSGIGTETSLELARRGARVILACRNLEKAQKAADRIKALSGNKNVVARHLELASLRSVQNFADQINRQEERLDILINNAGIGSAKDGTTTEDNFDPVFGINHFGHFLLTNLLLDLLRKSAPSRVVTVSSLAYSYTNETEMDLTRNDPDSSAVLYPHLKGYESSKLANILFARELAKREQSRGVVSVSLHPGVIYTPIWKKSMEFSSTWSKVYYALSPLLWFLLIGEKSGAQTTIHCALDESIVQLSGSYFDNCAAVADLTPLALNDTLAGRLWEASCEATGLKY